MTTRVRGLYLCAWLAGACDGESAVLDAGEETSDAAEANLDDLSFTSVWGAAPDDIWAVGSAGAIVHFDGDHWQRFAGITAADLTSVHGYSVDDVWAVGTDVALHWDGTSWSVELQEIGETLLGVWQNGPHDVWMVGLAWISDSGVVRHWDGHSWSGTELRGVSSLWEVWNSPDNTLWFGGSAVGGTGFLGHGQANELSRASYDGGSLRGIWGHASDDVWVAPYEGAMQHWDGSSWTEHDTGSDSVRLLSVSGSAPNDVWAVGLHGVIEHYSGDTWTQVESNTDATLWSVWAPAQDNAWAVGGTILHWDGDSWQQFDDIQDSL
jgi:hypothetical protein